MRHIPLTFPFFLILLPSSARPAAAAAALTPAATPTATATATATATPSRPGPAPDDLSEIQAALASDAQATDARANPPAAPSDPSSSPVQSLNPDISLIGDFAVAAFSDPENHQTGGHDPTESGFNLQQLELSFAAAVDPYFRFDSHLVFGADGFELEEAYGTTLDLPAHLQARFGQFLTRFGRLNATHPHAWDFVDQPLAIGRIFGGEGSRGLGIELSYLTPLPWYVELVASANRADGEGTARSFWGAENPGVHGIRDLLYVTAIKQFFPLSDDWSLLFGASAAFGPNASGPSNRSEVYGADLYLKYRPITGQSVAQLTLQSEWLYRRRQVPDSVLADFNGYTQLAYRFTQRWSTAVRYEYGSAATDPAGNVAFDPLDPQWIRARTRAALALSFFPSEFSRLRLQGSRDAGLGADAVWAAFLAAELAIGAHGAHAF